MSTPQKLNAHLPPPKSAPRLEWRRRDRIEADSWPLALRWLRVHNEVAAARVFGANEATTVAIGAEVLVAPKTGTLAIEVDRRGIALGVKAND